MMIDYKLEIDYSLLMGQWSDLLNKFLQTEDMYNLMLSLHENYKNKKDYYPSKKDIFKSFKDVRLNNITVVIINCTPTFNHRSNGLAFANKDSLINDFDPTLFNLFNGIENHICGGLMVDKDYTLSHWTDQGVFLLNTALTGTTKKPDVEEWSKFINYFITYLNDMLIHSGVIFAFIGDNGTHYTSKINQRKHNVLQFQTLNVDALEDINQEITEQNGREFRIQW
jgi:uracil DNA glycosylase